MVPEYDFTVHRGEDFSPVLLFGDENGDAIDVHGYAVKMVISRSGRSEPVDTLSTINGRITTEFASNKAKLSWSTSQTAAIKNGTYTYKVTLEDEAGVQVRVVLEGKFYVLP